MYCNYYNLSDELIKNIKLLHLLKQEQPDKSKKIVECLHSFDSLYCKITKSCEPMVKEDEKGKYIEIYTAPSYCLENADYIILNKNENFSNIFGYLQKNGVQIMHVKMQNLTAKIPIYDFYAPDDCDTLETVNLFKPSSSNSVSYYHFYATWKMSYMTILHAVNELLTVFDPFSIGYRNGDDIEWLEGNVNVYRDLKEERESVIICGINNVLQQDIYIEFFNQKRDIVLKICDLKAEDFAGEWKQMFTTFMSSIEVLAYCKERELNIAQNAKKSLTNQDALAKIEKMIMDLQSVVIQEYMDQYIVKKKMDLVAMEEKIDAVQAESGMKEEMKEDIRVLYQLLQQAQDVNIFSAYLLHLTDGKKIFSELEHMLILTEKGDYTVNSIIIWQGLCKNRLRRSLNLEQRYIDTMLKYMVYSHANQNSNYKYVYKKLYS